MTTSGTAGPVLLGTEPPKVLALACFAAKLLVGSQQKTVVSWDYSFSTCVNVQII